VKRNKELDSLLENHNLNEREKGKDSFEPWIGVNCEIHPNDEIFRFVYEHPTSTNPLRDYFADGWRTMYELMVVLEKLEYHLTSCDSFLEFASGYGRLTRHLAKFPGADKVHASDLMPESIEFIKEKFAVNGFYSDSDCALVKFPRKYEIVFVLSLFSHLPRNSWGNWLEKLSSAVEPGGYLIFSTHGKGFAERNKVELDSEGFFFIANSESDHLAGDEYGTTITAPEFVEGIVEKISGIEVVLFQADHFWAGQDVWVLKKSC